VRTPDDEQFEAYLRRFQPIVPEPVPTISVEPSSRRSLSLRAWLAIAAAIILIGVVALQFGANQVVVPSTSSGSAFAGRVAPSEPLTMQSANAWLATAPSFKAAVDSLAFGPQNSMVPQGKQSAIAVLSKEKIRL
jgi:hypothetical protein